ncbi:MAG: hypothetical protein JXP72_08535 [Coriobacteriia bacterium]|nr:hypothetical protein [Coriobacteriia bacterium]
MKGSKWIIWAAVAVVGVVIVVLLSSGGQPTVADAGDAGATNGLPVLYEFYTDW